MPVKSIIPYPVLILSFLVVLNSCTQYRYIYAPSVPNQPMFTEKGDSKIAAYASSNGDGNILTPDEGAGYDLHAAYAFTDHWGITASYFNRKEESGFENKNNYPLFSNASYKRNLTDIGAGYFTPLDRDRRWFFSLYGQYGWGKFSFTDLVTYDSISYPRFYSNQLNKWSLQPAFYFTNDKSARICFSTAFILKYSFVRYTATSTNYTADEVDYFKLNRLQDRTINYFEPTWNMQLGSPKFDWLKLDINFTFCSQPFYPGDLLKSRGTNYALGLTMDLFKINKNKKNNFQDKKKPFVYDHD